MRRADRARAHAIAESYGCAGRSYDREPRRFIRVVKAPGARAPRPLLSKVRQSE